MAVELILLVILIVGIFMLGLGVTQTRVQYRRVRKILGDFKTNYSPLTEEEPRERDRLNQLKDQGRLTYEAAGSLSRYDEREMRYGNLRGPLGRIYGMIDAGKERGSDLYRDIVGFLNLFGFYEHAKTAIEKTRGTVKDVIQGWKDRKNRDQEARLVLLGLKEEYVPPAVLYVPGAGGRMEERRITKRK